MLTVASINFQFSENLLELTTSCWKYVNRIAMILLSWNKWGGLFAKSNKVPSKTKNEKIVWRAIDVTKSLETWHRHYQCGEIKPKNDGNRILINQSVQQRSRILISLAVNKIIRIYRPNNWEDFCFIANKKNLLWKRRTKLIFVHSVEIEWERIQIQKNRNTLNLLIFKWFTRVWKWFWGVKANEKWNDSCICIIKYPVKCIYMTISQTAHRPKTHWANRKQNVIRQYCRASAFYIYIFFQFSKQ